MGALVITHYQRILNYIKPDLVHVFVDGRIVASGGPELAHTLEAEGYDALHARDRRGRRAMTRGRDRDRRTGSAPTTRRSTASTTRESYVFKSGGA